MLDDSSGEKSPHEPEEFDPNSLGPDVPTPPATPSDADSEVRGMFWVLVLIANVALMAGSLGLMFIVFQGKWTPGAQLVVVGLVLGLYVYYRVRRFQSS
ncbi:MAG: hypothetical protein V5A25_13565 [Halovenus sp.]